MFSARLEQSRFRLKFGGRKGDLVFAITSSLRGGGGGRRGSCYKVTIMRSKGEHTTINGLMAGPAEFFFLLVIVVSFKYITIALFYSCCDFLGLCLRSRNVKYNFDIARVRLSQILQTIPCRSVISF